MCRDVEDLKKITRANNRSFEIYKFIVDWYNLPEINLRKGSYVLDAGCGRAYAAPGILNEIGETGKLVCVDINDKGLKIGSEYFDFWLLSSEEFNKKYGKRSSKIKDRLKKEHQVINKEIHLSRFKHMFDIDHHLLVNKNFCYKWFDSKNDKDVLNTRCNLVYYVEDMAHLTHCPNNSFDKVLSIWSFYQVKYKISAINELLRVLKPGGVCHMVNPGNILILSKSISKENLLKIKDFVWEGKQRGFEWNSGWKDLLEILNDLGINSYELLEVPDFIERYLSGVSVSRGLRRSTFPPGSCMIEKKSEVGLKKKLPVYFDFVSNKNSVFIPIYVKSL